MINPRTTLDDLRTFWKGCIATHNGVPLLVIGVARKEDTISANVKEIQTGRIFAIDLKDEFTLKPPDSRLGFVNLNGMAIYTSRTPVRRFMMGINDSNLTTKHVPDMRYERGEIHRVSTSSIEFANTLLGKYPSFEEALEQVKVFGGLCAFDRQFAVSQDRKIYYKTDPVGIAARGAVDHRGMIFNKNREYLKSVIGAFNHDIASQIV